MEIGKRITEAGLAMGHMISYSKSEYRKRNPENEVYFNANIFTEFGKVWWGDIDLTISGEALQSVANETGEKLYVLREMDGRFEHEDRDISEVRKVAVKTYAPTATVQPELFGVT